MLAIRQYADETFGVAQKKIRTLVGCEPPREAERQHVEIKHACRFLDLLRGCALASALAGQPLPGEFDKAPASIRPHLPEPLIFQPAHTRLQVPGFAQPPALSAGIGPKPVGFLGVPGWHVYPVGDVAYGHFVLRPSREKPLEKPAADFSVQPAYAVEVAAAADGEIRHVEGLRAIGRVPPAERQQVVERNAQPVLGISFHKPLHQVRSETVKARVDRRMRCEKIAGPCDGQGHIEG